MFANLHGTTCIDGLEVAGVLQVVITAAWVRFLEPGSPGVTPLFPDFEPTSMGFDFRKLSTEDGTS